MVSPCKSPPPPPTKAAVEPQFGRTFDPWNSSSTGHQRAENRLGASTGWRASRNAKLQSQFRGGAGGGDARVPDTAGAGSPDWDPHLQAVVPPELRARARTSVADMLARRGTMRRGLQSAAAGGLSASSSSSSSSVAAVTVAASPSAPRSAEEPDGSEAEGKLAEVEKEPAETAAKPLRKIFDGVVVYVNGSTHPLISDHKLKQILAEHGASMSTHLGRRKVTHVILGRPAGGRSGAGGSLSGGKLQKEIRKLGGAAVQFVGVEWVLDSIKAGRRIPEARFGPVKVAAKGQQSVYGMYKQPEATKPPGDGRGSTTGVHGPEASAVRTPDAPDDEPPPSAQRF